MAAFAGITMAYNKYVNGGNPDLRGVYKSVEKEIEYE
jgi:hypothetical protein